MLDYDKKIRIAIEPKPNEPMDHAYIPTIGHAIGRRRMSDDPKRVGVIIETAHAILAGLDPSDEMGFALAYDKLWSVHLNDQNGLKFDQDKTFGSVDLRGPSTRSASSTATTTANAASWSASTSRPCGPRSRTWPPSTCPTAARSSCNCWNWSAR